MPDLFSELDQSPTLADIAPRARASDPATSHEAAASMHGRMATKYRPRGPTAEQRTQQQGR